MRRSDEQTESDRAWESVLAELAGETPRRALRSQRGAACQRAHHETLHAVGFASEPIRIRPGLKDRILARVPNGPAVAPDETAGAPLQRMIVRGGETPWEPTEVEGVSSRLLFADPSTGMATVLVRMEPGARYPSHHHRGDEECLVLEGDIRVGDEPPLIAGDYQLAREGSDHPIQSTENGCLLLVRRCVADEFID